MTSSPPPADDADKRAPDEEPEMPEFSYDLKVPKDRVAVLIGPKGRTKKELEAQTRTRIIVDSKEGDVKLQGKDSLALFALRGVVKAIGRGFNPEFAQLLLKQDHVLEVVDIAEYGGKEKNHLVRLRGRVIGADGKARTTIERVTETFIVVYGKTIGIIGTTERAMLARRAVEALLEGSTHASVYKWLEKSAKKVRREEGALL